MIKAASRVFETSITTGTGTLNLSGPISGFRSFVSAVGSGSKVSYAIDNGTEWENGIGTVTAGSPDKLSRDDILESSNSGAAVNFGGTLNVRLAPLPAIVMQRDEAKNFTDFKGVSSGTGNAHAVTMPITPIAYTDGMIVMYNAPAANTGAVTINIDSLGAKALKVNGVDPISGLIPSGALIVAVYNQTNNCFDGINLYKADKAIADLAASLGTAAAKDVGTSAGNLVEVQDGGELPALSGINLTDLPSQIVVGTAIATTSGVHHDFSIPNTAKRITVNLSGVSTNGSSPVLVQIGTGGVPETSGYLGASTFTNAGAASSALTSGFVVYFQTNDAAAAIRYGRLVLEKIDGNTWVATGDFSTSNALGTSRVSGSKVLSGALNMVRLTTVAGNQDFDAGLVNITYE